MKLVWSDKFKYKIGDYFDYCLVNYGAALTKKKRTELDKILNGLARFPESGRIEPLLQGMDKEYRNSLEYETQSEVVEERYLNINIRQ